MRVPPDRRSNKASKKATASERSVDAQRANDRATIEAELEKSPFHRGNTAGGRKPPYESEFAIQAKAMCARGATTDELAEAFKVSPKIVGMWQVIHNDFYEACKIAPGCVERVKRSIFDIAMGPKVITEKIVESGGQTQTTRISVTLPANLAASKFFVPNEAVAVRSDLAQLLLELQGTRVGIKYRGPDGNMMSEKEHVALGGIAGGGEIDWSKKSPEEISLCMQRLLELRQNP